MSLNRLRQIMLSMINRNTVAVARRCSEQKVFLDISQNSQENTCERVSFLIKETLTQVFSCKFCEISKENFFNRKPPVAAYGDKRL